MWMKLFLRTAFKTGQIPHHHKENGGFKQNQQTNNDYYNKKRKEEKGHSFSCQERNCL